MKNIVFALVICVAVSLDGMHVTKKVCKEIPKALPVAFEAISQAFAKEIKARDLVVAAQKMIRVHRETNTDSSGIVSNLRVNLLPALIVASAETRSVLSIHEGVVSVNFSHYDQRGKPQEYIQEFGSCAFTKEAPYSEEHLAYVRFLKYLSRNPDALKVTQLK